jgi:alginate O-acetyltransferase complex protein AlgI
MNFLSLSFFVFLSLTAGVYFALPGKWRWPALLAGSYFFYLSWNAWHVFVLLAATLAGYGGARWMASAKSASAKRWILLGSLGVNLGILMAFKAGPLAAPVIRWAMPLGLSFFSLQIMSHSLEVYYGRFQAERNLGRFALYASFFPLLQAGPIERPARLLPQCKSAADFDFERLKGGLQLMLWGFFKKLALADNLAPAVKQVFDHVHDYSGPTHALAVFFFAIQIYCDFSGYTDIARGTGQILGFDLMENFRRPYQAESISDFWSRWHISLTTWLRDYVFLPLSFALLRQTPRERLLGVKLETWTYGAATTVTMLLCGLWHGVTPTFLCWGGLIGFYLFFGQVTRKARRRLAKRIGLTRVPRVQRKLRTAGTFSLICFSWIFFRAASLADASVIITRLASGWLGLLRPLRELVLRQDFSCFRGLAQALHVTVLDLEIIACGLVVLALVQRGQRRGPMREYLDRLPLGIRWLAYYLLIAWILFLGKFQTKEFIYMQF